MRKTAELAPNLPRVRRLGLATRGNTHLRPDDVAHAIDRGLNYLNWCGKPDGLSKTVAALGAKRKEVVVAVQFKSSGADEAEREFAWILDQLNTDYLDVATLYYVEAEDEWQQIIGPGGAWDTLNRLKGAGALKLIGLTSHQRKLAARWAQAAEAASSSHYLDLLMIRYNAAHRGAETEVFPVTEERGMPAVTFTGLRWCDLLASTPNDPPGFEPPTALECYRFCLAHPGVSVALVAPNDRAELEENLTLLDAVNPHPTRSKRSATTVTASSGTLGSFGSNAAATAELPARDRRIHGPG